MNRAREVELMSKLVELKIRNYEKIIHDHKRANKHFDHELLILIQRCEKRYKSVLKAPDDSPEWREIVLKRTEKPVLSFQSRTMRDMPAYKAAEIRNEVAELYNRGYPTSIIANILGIRTNTARITIVRYQQKINSQNAGKVNS